MRILVVLKTNKYAVAESHILPVVESSFETFILTDGARLNVPKNNIDFVLRYADAHIELFRIKLGEYEKNDDYQKI